MKQRILTILLSLCMLLSLLPAAAGAMETPKVTVDGNHLFANGNAITLMQGDDETKTLVYLDSDLENPIALTGPTGDTTNGYDLTRVNIFGGSDGRRKAVTINGNTSITMEGGTVYRIAGGGRGPSDTDPSKICTVNGTASVTLKGGNVTYLYGAAMAIPLQQIPRSL